MNISMAVMILACASMWVHVYFFDDVGALFWGIFAVWSAAAVKYVWGMFNDQ